MLRDSMLDIDRGDCIAVIQIASTAPGSGVGAAVGIMPGMAGKGAGRPAGSGVIAGSAADVRRSGSERTVALRTGRMCSDVARRRAPRNTE